MLGSQTTNYFNLTPNICESSVWHFLHVNPLGAYNSEVASEYFKN